MYFKYKRIRKFDTTIHFDQPARIRSLHMQRQNENLKAERKYIIMYRS